MAEPKEAALTNRIKMVLAAARTTWPDPKKRPEIKPMAIKLAGDKKLNFSWETIRKILSGTYEPMKRRDIPKL